MSDKNVNRQFGTVLEESDSAPGRTLRDIGFINPGDHGPPELSREAERALYKARVARLGEELDHMSRLISWARECLENELFSGLGYKRLGINDKDLQKIASLSTSLERAVSAKIRYDKSAKDMADSMTPAEEFESVASYIRTLSYEDSTRLSTIIANYRGNLRAAMSKRALSGPEPEGE